MFYFIYRLLEKVQHDDVIVPFPYGYGADFDDDAGNDYYSE